MLVTNGLIVISRTVNIAQMGKHCKTHFDKLLQSEGPNDPQLSHDDPVFISIETDRNILITRS
jgi:hypothetical protein